MIVRPRAFVDHDVPRGCRTAGGRPKQPYPHRAQARRARRRLMVRGARGLHVYRCTNCGCYHVGNSSPWSEPAAPPAERARP